MGTGTEVAKTVREGIELTRDAGAFLSKALGELPADVVGLMGADYLNQVRVRNTDKYVRRTKQILEERNVKKVAEVPLSVGVPLIQAAANESRDELVDMWARLLAAAMDPARANDVRLSYIEIVRQMDPLDAVIMAERLKTPGNLAPNPRDFFSSRLKRNPDEIEVSFANLRRLGISNPQESPDSFYPVALGRSLGRALGY